MGKALILESLKSGHYRIQYQFDNTLVDQRIAELTASIANYDGVEIPAQELIVSSAEQSVEDAKNTLNIAIIGGILDEIKDATDALNQSAVFLEKQRRDLSLLEMLRLNVDKALTFIEANKKEPFLTDAWCADFNAKIKGEVGTIEAVSSRQHPVIIRPAGIEGDQASHVNADGIMASPLGMNEYGWLCNTMLQPGHQKWFSRYRIGTIRSFSEEDPNICSVYFDEAKSLDPELDVNQQERAYQLPITYLECDGEAFKLKDRVVVEHEEDKGPNGERGIFIPKRVIGFESHPRPCGVVFVIWSGDDTITYNRNYFILRKGQLQEREDLDSWELTDDGKYNLVWEGVPHEDPDDFSYQTLPIEGDGIRVPETDTGVDAKKQDGTSVRFMTNQTLEDELFVAFEVDTGSFVYEFLGQDDSLTRTPYKIKSKASVCRYTTKGDSYNDFGILTFNRIIEEAAGILIAKTWHTNSFGDAFPVIRRGYVTRFDSSREFIDLAADELVESALVCAVKGTSDYRGIEYLIRAEAFTLGIAQLGEPLTEQKYNFRDSNEEGYGFVGDTGNLYRSWDESTDDVYMIDANTIFGKEVDGDGFTTVSGQQYINNDIKLPYGVTEDRKLTYVRKQKDIEFTLHNASLYVADTLVEESDFQDVISLWGDGDLPAEHNGPILIRQTDYRPLQVHHGDFDIVLFRRVVYKEHETELLPYKILRTISATNYFHAQIRRTIITSEIQYAISVNGTITELSYKTTTREHRLSVLSTPYSGPSIPTMSLYALGPWMDIGFDKNGVETEEDNSQLTRIFISESGGNALVGFDAFPMSCRHDLIVTGSTLHPEFDDSVLSFPPYIDLEYEEIKDRKWLVFDSSGVVVEDIIPPSENRINGVCMLDPRG